MKKSPVAAMSNIRDAVRRKSVGLSFTTNFSIFSRSASSTGEDSEHGAGEDGEDFNDEAGEQPLQPLARGLGARGGRPGRQSVARRELAQLVRGAAGAASAAPRRPAGGSHQERAGQDADAHGDVPRGHHVPCSEGGGIFKGSLGSMLPFIMKAKEDKLGIVLFDDIFKDSMRSGEIDCSAAVHDGLAEPRLDVTGYTRVYRCVPGWWQSARGGTAGSHEGDAAPH
ncbi:hypothetical protein ON010_g16941 [Phytophthora cinnamomi]|nr:hypothetical protein ON010_g16941 [Phytophthora cinnamomi]